MYYEHFGFSEPPFSISPDPRFLYMSERHREALAHLIYGAGENGGFVLLTGGVGTGKTTLIRSLLQQELKDVDVAMCLNPGLSEYDFIASILDELHIAYDDSRQSLKVLIDALNRHLLKAHANGRQTVLIIDEAQNLSRETLEQVRLLTNLETDNQKLLRIILVGQEELQEKLARDDLRQLSQRITVRYHLTALNPSEVEDYIDHRISVARGNPKIFPASAMRKIYQLTNGIPRLINVLCDRALLGAYSEGADKVAVKHINLAADEALANAVNSGASKPKIKPARSGLSKSILAVALVAAIIGGGYYYAVQNFQGLKQNYPMLEQYSGLFLQDETPAQSLEYLPAAASTGTASPQNQATVIEVTTPDLSTQINPTATNTSTDDESGKVNVVEQSETTNTTATNANSETSEVATTATENTQTAKAEVLEATVEEVKVKENKPEIVEPPEPQVSVDDLLAAPRSILEGLPMLLRLWDKPTSFPAQQLPCDYIKSHGLVCSEQAGGFGLLTKINRPSLLELSKDGINSTWVVVTAIDGTDIQINNAGADTLLPFAEIAPYWTGKFLTLLRQPNNSRSIVPGESGEKIRWLRQRLALANHEDYTKISDSLKFDDALAGKVKNFQSQYHLEVDGIVGNQTLLYLYNTLVTTDTPQLVE